MLARSTTGDQTFQNRYLQVLEAVKDDGELIKAAGVFASSIRSGTETSESKRQELFSLYRQVARSLGAIGRHEKSVDFLIEAINQDPLNLENLKWSYLAARSVDLGGRIRDYYLKLADKASSNYRWSVRSPRIHQLDGNGEGALRQMQRALSIEPHLEFLYDEIFRVHYALNQMDQALDVLKKQLAISDGKRDVLVEIFTLLSALNRDKEMSDVIANLVKISPYSHLFVDPRRAAETKEIRCRFLIPSSFWKRSGNGAAGTTSKRICSLVSIAYVCHHRLREGFDQFKSLRAELAAQKESQENERVTTNLDRVIDFLKNRFPEAIRQYATASDIQQFREGLKPDLYALSGLEFSESFLRNLNFLRELTTLKSYYFNFYLNDLNRYGSEVGEYVDFFEGLFFPRGDFDFFSEYMVNYEHFKLRDPKTVLPDRFPGAEAGGEPVALL